MEAFIVDFRGSLLVEADSEEAAHKKAEEWTGLLEEKAPALLPGEVGAVTLRCRKKESDASKKVRKALLAAVATENTADAQELKGAKSKKSKKF